MMLRKSLIILALVMSFSCSTKKQSIYLGQGLMAGEASTTSIILQARLTKSTRLINGDIIGKSGIGLFQIDLDSTFNQPIVSDFLEALPENDFILKTKIEGLYPGATYFYRLLFGPDNASTYTSSIATFQTLPGIESEAEVSMAIVTGMNYYHFHYGKYDSSLAYSGTDKNKGYPALEAIKNLHPAYFIGTGDNVYFDHPNKVDFEAAIESGRKPHPANYEGAEVTNKAGMRKKYHEQFSQPRFIDLFRNLATYWEKDDHDYRFNDADTLKTFPISHPLGINNFKEQLPIVDPKNQQIETFRTHRMNKDLQVWMLEGRDYRSPNKMADGPEKTLLGKEQLNWLKTTLMASDASFKIIISPTPMVGPDDAYKSDNHVNPKGFRQEGEALFNWMAENGFPDKNLYIICGDRHWQYHARHPSGIEEFSTGALVDNNARPGRLAGDPNSTDPHALIKQFYIQGDKASASGGFLVLSVKRKEGVPVALFKHYNEKGILLYEVEKDAR